MNDFTPEQIINDPILLKLDIFCRGLRIEDEIKGSEFFKVYRTRAGLGSGIELILGKEVRLNAPINEKFVSSSPYLLKRDGETFRIYREDIDKFSSVDVTVFKPPQFYTKKTSSGKVMSRIAVMQGSVLSIYIGDICEFWRYGKEKRCRFCTTGINVGTNEEVKKSEADILETIEEARRECDITFVHFNSGYNALKDLNSFLKLIEEIRKKTGLLTGVQFPPYKDLKIYNRFRDAGVDHLSFCIEFGSEQFFKEVCYGKFTDIGQDTYLNAIQYCAKIFPAGSVSGEIIAGVEPIEETRKIITRITDYGAFPTICVFRPLIGSLMEDLSPPSFETMSEILGFAYIQMVRNNIPVGLAPGINVSIIVTPLESKIFAPRDIIDDLSWNRYHMINGIKRALASFYIKKFRLK